MTSTVGWRRVRLGDVADLQTGVAISQGVVERPVRRPYLRVANVQAGALRLEEVKYATVPEARVVRYELRPGDVLMTEGGDFDKLGRGTVWGGEIAGCLHQNHVFAVRPDPEQLLPEFLAAWTGSHSGRKYFRSSSKQTTNLASINSAQVLAAPLLLPPLSEQRAIVEILRLLDRSIGIADSHASAVLRRKRGLMQKLLTGKTRFPRYSGVPWVRRNIGDLFEEVSRPIEWDDSATYELLSIRRRSGGVFLRGRMPASRILTKTLFDVQPGDILLSKMQAVHGAIGLAQPEHAGMKISGSYVVLRPKEAADASPAFFAYLTQLPQMYRAVLQSSYGVHIEKMTFNLDWYLRTSILLPETLQEQEQIAQCLSAAEREIALLERQRALLYRQRRAVTDKLLSGQVRVPVPASEVRL